MKVIANSVDLKERELSLWYNSSANPANRVKDRFDRMMQKQHTKHLSPFTSQVCMEKLNNSPESVRASFEEINGINFLSPTVNIEKYKCFP